ncbi:MAG: ATP-binding cassette domain-containing protein [Coriobacteriia bacterium]|nr:ATP-binding cassette domain-containing protein [Coriobacteriia bacterium]
MGVSDVFLSIKNLSKSFTIYQANKQIKAINSLSLHMNKGEFVGITGKSGSGKSTVLKCIYRTNLVDGGNILYDSEAFGMIDLAKASEREIIYLRRYEFGYISQFLHALPRTTAKQIVAASAKDRYESKDEQLKAAEAMLKHFEIDEELWDVYPNTFSGGEKLRLNIAAAMVKHPRFLLLDEPTASLDNESKKKVRDLIEQLKAEGTTMLGIFHDLEFMEGLCDREFNMQAGGFVGE